MQSFKSTFAKITLVGETVTCARRLPSPPARAIWLGLMDATSNAG
jgi:hypothetical protein